MTTRKNVSGRSPRCLVGREIISPRIDRTTACSTRCTSRILRDVDIRRGGAGGLLLVTVVALAALTRTHFHTIANARHFHTRRVALPVFTRATVAFFFFFFFFSLFFSSFRNALHSSHLCHAPLIWVNRERHRRGSITLLRIWPPVSSAIVEHEEHLLKESLQHGPTSRKKYLYHLPATLNDSRLCKKKNSYQQDND